MDSFSLRQEQAELEKYVSHLKHVREIGEARMKEMHVEEMKYLEEIPVYKKQAQDAKIQMQEMLAKISPLKKEIDELQKDLMIVRGLNTVENKALTDLKETQKKIIEETKTMNEQIKQRHEQLKQRELAVEDKEKSAELISVTHKNRDSELNDRELVLDRRDKNYEIKEQSLDDAIRNHRENVSAHNDRVKIFDEEKTLHISDQKSLDDKLSKADKLVQDHIHLKASLLLQSEKLAKETQIEIEKQKSLDRSLADLKNQENSLKIKELRVNKLINDNNIQKELAELSK